MSNGRLVHLVTALFHCTDGLTLTKSESRQPGGLALGETLSLLLQTYVKQLSAQVPFASASTPM